MKPTRILNLLSAVTLTVCLSLAPLNLHAASGTWTGATGGTWATATNWSASPAPGSTSVLNSAEVATFNATSANSTITIDLNRNVRSLLFDTAATAYTIGSAGANAGNSLILTSGGNITLASTITTTGNTQTFNAPIVLAAATTTTAGTYQFINSTALANNNRLVVAGNISGGTTTQGVGLTLSGANSGNNVLSGVISNGGATLGLSISKANTATFSITGTNNSFTGGLNPNQGVLEVATISDIGTNSSIGAGGGISTITSSGGNATLRITGAGGTTNRAVTITRSGVVGNSNGLILESSGSAPVTFSGGITSTSTATASTTGFNLLTLSGTNTGANTISGSIKDFNTTAGNERLLAVTKSNTAALWILNSAGSNYTGPTTISGGTLAGIGANAFGNTSGISIAGPGVLSLRGDGSTSFVKASDNSSYAVSTTATDSTINVDQATGAGTGAKTMSIGTLTASSADKYVLNFTGANNTSLSAGAMTGSAFAGTGTNTIANAITGGGSLTLASYTSANTSGGDTLTFSGVGNTTVTGAVTSSATILNLRQNGTGAVLLSGNSNYTGTTTVSTGSLVVGANAPSGSSGALGNTNSEVVLGTTGGSSDAALLIGGAFTVGRDIRTPTNNTTDAGTRVLTLGGNAAANSIFSGNVTLGTTNQAGRGVILTAAGGGQVTFSGVIQNPTGMDASSYTINKTGLGTVVLSNTNTYTGATAVSAGKLAVNGSTSASSVVDVSNGGILAGSGKVGGNATIASGGTLAPGNSPGVLTVSGTTTLNSGSVFEWEIDTAQSTPETNRGVAYDGLNTSSLALAGPGPGAIFKIMLTGTQDFTDTFWNQTRTWTDIFKSADNSTILSSWASVFSGGFQYAYKGQSIAPTTQGSFTMTGSSLTWSAVPEPRSALAGIAILAGLIHHRRRKN